MADEIQPKQVQELSLYSQEDIQRKIYTIRGVQVMLDRDLAVFYGVVTKRINESVKRNPTRFPEDFYFQLTKDEYESLRSQNTTSNVSRSQNIILDNGSESEIYVEESRSRSQNATLNRGRGKNLKYLPYVFTEPGVGQLSSVLKSPTADIVSVRIQRAFVAMRRFITQNAGLFQRLDQIERHQIQTDARIDETNARFDQLMDKLDDGSLKQKLGIFFDGQMFEAFVLVEELIQKATRRIVLIDDYVTASVLQRFHKRNAGVTVDCYVKKCFATQDLKDAFANYHKQYPSEPTTLHTFERSHDRWLIIDDTVYHFGASIKDLGKKWFSVDIITETTADDLISRL